MHTSVPWWILHAQQQTLRHHCNPFTFTSNLVSEQLIGGSRNSLVRHTTIRHGQLQMEKFSLPYYLPVKPIETNILEVYIRDINGKEHSFLKKTTTCTFHFKKKSWLTT